MRFFGFFKQNYDFFATLYIAFKSIGGYSKCCHECGLGVDLVIDNFVYYDVLPLYQILK